MLAATKPRRAQPRCTSFQTWGFTDRHCSFCGVDGAEPPGSFYFDRDYLPKPALVLVATAVNGLCIMAVIVLNFVSLNQIIMKYLGRNRFVPSVLMQNNN